FQNLDNSQMCCTNISPQENYFASWVKLATGKTDILIINAQRDTVPEIFQEEVVSSIPINSSEDILVVEKNNYQIIQIFNHWFTFFKHTPEYKDLTAKFFRNYRSMDKAQISQGNKHISPYDNLIKEHSRILGWDWHLLASLIYQESKFKAAVSSPRGAIGLMQIKESVANKYGIDDIYNPNDNIKAGTLHLKRLQGMYLKMGADSTNARLLAIAAYNCGEGRMSDCMSLATEEGKNPLLWSDIREIIPLLREEKYYTSPAVKYGSFKGKETLKYVEKIEERYLRYIETTP
ncbi:MAG: transglycosylase SLT domain-containing protein, partial [Bacteroidales bacterium]|nr:transglycosylase SLT domain-containing protein [Bacteroidales bacterium]